MLSMISIKIADNNQKILIRLLVNLYNKHEQSKSCKEKKLKIYFLKERN